jgi:hypothetical protein
LTAVSAYKRIFLDFLATKWAVRECPGTHHEQDESQGAEQKTEQEPGDSLTLGYADCNTDGTVSHYHQEDELGFRAGGCKKHDGTPR